MSEESGTLDRRPTAGAAPTAATASSDAGHTACLHTRLSRSRRDVTRLPRATGAVVRCSALSTPAAGSAVGEVVSTEHWTYRPHVAHFPRRQSERRRTGCITLRNMFTRLVM